MRTLRTLLVSLIFGMLLFLFTFPALGQGELFTVAINENRPLAYFDDDGVPAGFYVDLLNYIAEKEGWALEYVEFPRAETFELVDKGEIDIIATIGYHELFIDRYVFTEEKILNNWGIVYVQMDSSIESVLDLEGKSVAILEASTHGEHFKKLIDDFGIECSTVEVGSFAEVASLLEEGEVDAGILNRMIGLSFETIYKIEGTTIVFNPIDVRIATSQTTPSFVIERIDAHLEELKNERNSYYYQSFSRWFGLSAQTIFPQWLTWVLILGTVFLFFLSATSLFLRSQVRTRTADLLTQNQELESEIEEHHRTQETLRESEGRFKSIFENSTIGLYRTTPDGQVLMGNPTLVHMLGYSSFEELAQRDLSKTEFGPEFSRSTFLENIESEGKVSGLEAAWLTKSGKRLFVRESAQVVRDRAGNTLYYEGTVEDITERKRAEETLQQRAQEITALNTLSAKVNRSLSVEQVASAAVNGVLSATAADIVFLLMKEGDDLVPKEIAYSEQETELDDLSIEKITLCLCEMAIREGRSVYSKKLSDDIRCKADECKRAGLHSSAALPLFQGNEIFAVLGLGTNSVLDFEEQAEFLETLASEVANGMKNARLFAEIQIELSERKKMEIALIESEEKFRILFENSPVGIGVADREGKLLLYNEAILQPGGYRREDAELIEGIYALYKDKGQRDEVLRLFLEQGFVKNFEVQFKRKDGSAYDAALSLVPVNFEGKLCVQAIVEDRTERKRADDARKESQRRLSTLMSNLPGIAYRCKNDRDWTMEFISDGCESLTGYKPEEIVMNTRVSYGQVIHPDDREMVWSVIQDGLRKQPNFQINYRILTVCGDEKWVWEQGQGVYGEKGEIITLEGFISDITERVQAGEQLKLQSLALESAANAIFITDAKGSIQWVNSAFSSLTGYSFSEVLGKNPNILQSGYHTEVYYKEMWERISGGDIWRGEIINKRKNGELYTEEMTIAPLISSEGVVNNFIAIKQDITERVENEQALAKYTGQLETLNTVTAALSTSLELDSVLELILNQIRQVISLDSGAIFLAEGEYLRVVFDTGITPSVKGQVFRSGNELFDEVRRTGEPLVLNNVREDPRFKNWADFQNIESWIGIPLIVRGELIGVMTLDNDKPNAFQPEDIPLVSAFGSQSAQAIDNARQFRTSQRRLRRLDALHKIDEAISNSLDLRVTLSVLLEQLLAQLKVDAAVVLLYKSNLQSLIFAQGEGFKTTALQHTNLQLGQGRAGKVALERQDIFVSDLSQSEVGLLDAPRFKDEGFVAYYGVPLIAKGSLVGVLEILHRSPLEVEGEWVDYLHALAGQAAIAIDNISLFNNLQKSTMRLRQAYDATIEGWAQALELRDMETVGHSRRVVDTTIAVAQKLGISGDELGHIRRGALLHDIGKMGVPDSVLQKAGKLTDDEWEIMRLHPIHAYQWLSSIEYLRPALDIPYCHHEKWDGTGYPRGLQGEQIPLAARVFAIVDVWDALCSDRPYRKAWSRAKVIAYIQEQSGKYFDPKVVATFLEYIKDQELDELG